MKEIIIPDLAESVTEGTIVQWFAKEGDFVRAGDPLLELETDKINVEINSEQTGVVESIKKKAGDSVQVGEIVAVINDKETAADMTTTAQQKTEAEAVEPRAPEDNAATHKTIPPIASPATRKKARELGINLEAVIPKDPIGRITDEDFVLKSKQPTPSSSIEAKEEQNIERLKMTRRRQTIAKNLVAAQQTAAMLTTFNEIDMSKVMELRQRRKEIFVEKHNVKLGFMSFFTKAAVGALKAYPFLNAEIQGDEIVLKKFYDIGIAVSTDDGLVVPVVRNADRLSFAEIEREIMLLSEKARKKTLTLPDLTGGTFTITNGGVFGSLCSTPILNFPQVAILGMHAIQRRPVVIDNNDTVEVRPMMYVALSYDHRIIDGKEAVQFLAKIKELIEDPEDLLLEG